MSIFRGRREPWVPCLVGALLLQLAVMNPAALADEKPTPEGKKPGAGGKPDTSRGSTGSGQGTGRSGGTGGGQDGRLGTDAGFGRRGVGDAGKIQGQDGDTPLVLDMDRDGKLTLAASRPANVALFDIDADGRADMLEWLAPGEGLLALDLNHNGRIDSGAELFGNHTMMADKKKAEHGFIALAQYDINHDGWIDVKDAVFHKLIVWRDLDGDGQSQTNELVYLSKTDVTALSVSYEAVAEGKGRLEQGRSYIGQRAVYRTSSGNQHLLADVYFYVKSRAVADNK